MWKSWWFNGIYQHHGLLILVCRKIKKKKYTNNRENDHEFHENDHDNREHQVLRSTPFLFSSKPVSRS